MKLLVLTSEPVNATTLREAAGPETEDAEVLVVSPALHTSPLRFWLSDADAAIAKAEAVQEETVERLDAEGIDAAGDTGESDPVLALNDTLATFDADKIVVFTHPAGEEDYREADGWLDEARRRYGIPIEHRIVTR